MGLSTAFEVSSFIIKKLLLLGERGGGEDNLKNSPESTVQSILQID